MGFGVSVLQRLCKTSIKKNLYFEIKDKVIEEAFNGVRMEKQKRRVKVYGLDSNKEVRTRLIEILYNRVQNHKDKFISPMLHHELETMETKKNGKVEHCDGGHDDQVFSYLMAMYVWYDGQNLAENFGIQKNSLKTDEEVDIEDLNINTENQFTNVDVSIVHDPDNASNRQQQEIDDFFTNSSKIKLSSQFNKMLQEQEDREFQLFLSEDKYARQAYNKKYNVEQININGVDFISLPDDIYGSLEDDTPEVKTTRTINGNMFDLFSRI